MTRAAVVLDIVNTMTNRRSHKRGTAYFRWLNEMFPTASDAEFAEAFRRYYRLRSRRLAEAAADG